MRPHIPYIIDSLWKYFLSSRALAAQHNPFPVTAITSQDKYKEFMAHMVLHLYCYSKQRHEKVTALQ